MSALIAWTNLLADATVTLSVPAAYAGTAWTETVAGSLANIRERTKANSARLTLYSLINNHGPDAAEKALYGSDGEPGWLADAAAYLKRADACIVMDLDLSHLDARDAHDAVRNLHRCTARVIIRKGQRTVDTIDFHRDDGKKELRASVQIATHARIVEAPANFTHARHDLRGAAKAIA